MANVRSQPPGLPAVPGVFVFISSILYDAIVSYGKIIPYAYRGVPVDKVCADLSGPNTSDLSFKRVRNWRFGIPFQPPI